MYVHMYTYIYILFLLRKETNEIRIIHLIETRKHTIVRNSLYSRVSKSNNQRDYRALFYLYKNICVYTCLIESLTYSLF